MFNTKSTTVGVQCYQLEYVRQRTLAMLHYLTYVKASVLKRQIKDTKRCMVEFDFFSTIVPAAKE